MTKESIKYLRTLDTPTLLFLQDISQSIRFSISSAFLGSNLHYYPMETPYSNLIYEIKNELKRRRAV